MNKHIKNLFLGFLLSVALGVFLFSRSNNLDFSGYSFGGILGSGVSVFLISLLVAGLISLIFMIFKVPFWKIYYKIFWFVFLVLSFLVLVGTL